MRWLRKPAGDPLAVSMSSIKLGDRLLIVGTSDISLIVALATKSGLTGRTCMVDESESRAAQSAAAVEREGVLVETFATPAYSALPFDPGAFDVAVIRNVLRTLPEDRVAALAAEVGRVLRPGGRCLAIESEPRGGLARLFGGDRQAGDRPSAGDLEPALTAAGFRGVRTLAQREGLTFIEGVKANS